MPGKVVVFSPSRFSLYTICVVELLRREGIDVQCICVRRLLSAKRFLSEFRRDGKRLLKKIWRKLFLRKGAYEGDDAETIIALMRQAGIETKVVDEFSDSMGIPIVYCNGLNDDIVVEQLERHKPDLVVFTGGGLIRKEVLAKSGAGVLNCHMGILPRYRGMDVVEWPILEGRLDDIGVTVHFMDRGIDTGDILTKKRIPVRPNETVDRLRKRFEPIMCEEMVAATCAFLSSDIQRTPQQKRDGHQYFILHDRLMKLASGAAQTCPPHDESSPG